MKECRYCGLMIKDDETNEILFSGTISSKDIEGIDVEVDVSTVRFLRIEMNGRADTAVLVNAQLFK